MGVLSVRFASICRSGLAQKVPGKRERSTPHVMSGESKSKRSAAQIGLVRALMWASILAVVLGASAFAPVLAYPHDQPGTIKEYVNSDPDSPEAGEFSALGLGVINARGALQRGQRFEAAEIIYVVPGSPGEMAGLAGRRPRTEMLISAGIFVASFLCPPVILVSTALGAKMAEFDDFVIAVDGVRIHNVVELGAAFNQANPGEIVYLTVIRNGKRKQVRVVLPEREGESLSAANIFAGSMFAR